jgi:hypothetical protein
MPRKDSQRQRSSCACVGAYLFDTHPKCRKHSKGLDCQYFAPFVAGFKCCDICSQWTPEQWVAFRKVPRTHASRNMSSKKTADKKVDAVVKKKEIVKKLVKKLPEVTVDNSSSTVKLASRSCQLADSAPVQHARPAVKPKVTTAVATEVQVIVQQPESSAKLVVQDEPLVTPVGQCGPLNLDLSRPDQMYIMLQSYFRNQGVNPVGVRGQPVVDRGVSSTVESFMGSAGSSAPIHQLTGFDVPFSVPTTFRSTGVSLSEGNTNAMQNDLASAAPAFGQQGDQGFYLDDSSLGSLHYGVGARFQVNSGPRPHTLRGEGPEVESREIFPGSMPPERSSSGGTGLEASRGVTDPGTTTPGEITPIGTGQCSEYPRGISEGRPLAYSIPAGRKPALGVSMPSQGDYGQQPPVVADRRVTGTAPPQLTQGDKGHQYRDTVDRRSHEGAPPKSTRPGYRSHGVDDRSAHRVVHPRSNRPGD